MARPSMLPSVKTTTSAPGTILLSRASRPTEFHRQPLSGRVEDWRADLAIYSDQTTFPAPSTSRRNVRISRIARPHLLHAEAYGTYPAEATFGPVRRRVIGPFSRFGLGGPYKPSLEPDGSPLFTRNP